MTTTDVVQGQMHQSRLRPDYRRSRLWSGGPTARAGEDHDVNPFPSSCLNNVSRQWRQGEVAARSEQCHSQVDLVTCLTAAHQDPGTFTGRPAERHIST